MASDIRTRKPASNKAAAGGKGHNGAAYASVLIHDTITQAKNEIRVEVSLKDRLRGLMGLTAEDHTEFRATWEAARKEWAAKLPEGSKREDWIKSADEGRIANKIFATASLWQKLSAVVENSFKPDFNKSWAEITMAATAYGKGEGRSAGKNKNTGRKPAGILDKAKNFVKGNILTDKGVTRKELLTPTKVGDGVNAKESIPLVETIVMMVSMADAPDNVVDELVSKLNEFKANRAKAREAAKAVSQKAAGTSKTRVKATGNTQKPADAGNVGEQQEERDEAPVARANATERVQRSTGRKVHQ